MAKPQIARRLALIDGTQGDGFVDKALKIAFATSDQKNIDQHFGSAQSFAFYYVAEDEVRFSEVVAFEKADHDGNEDKLEVRIRALEGCAAVYCRAIGASAISRLNQIGVQPLRLPATLEIRAQLNLLRQELREGPASWVARALQIEKTPSRFDDMEAEGWNE